MEKIKEKPAMGERVKEKAVSAPKELLRKGLDDGSERLRTQLRDTAQQGRRDEYGGDAIEDTAASGLRRAEKELTRQRKKKPQEQPPEGGALTADATEQKPSAIKGKDTTSAGPQPQSAAERGRQQARQNAAQKAAKVKTKDTYIGAQTETQVTVAAEPQRQGQRVFMEERGRKAARWQAEQKRAVSRRRIKTAQALHSDRGGSAMPDRMRSEQIPHIKERAETSLPKPARKKHLPMERDIVSDSPRSKKIADTAKTLESAQKQAVMLQSSARTAREAAVQTARYQQAAKAAQTTAQKASQAAGRALRAILSAARSLAAAMMAGGSTVLSMVLVICLIGLLIDRIIRTALAALACQCAVGIGRLNGAVIPLCRILIVRKAALLRRDELPAHQTAERCGVSRAGHRPSEAEPASADSLQQPGLRAAPDALRRPMSFRHVGKARRSRRADAQRQQQRQHKCRQAPPKTHHILFRPFRCSSARRRSAPYPRGAGAECPQCVVIIWESGAKSNLCFALCAFLTVLLLRHIIIARAGGSPKRTAFKRYHAWIKREPGGFFSPPFSFSRSPTA